MKKRLLSLVLYVCLMMACTTPAAAETQLTFGIPESLTAELGDTITLPISVTSLPQSYDTGIVGFVLRVSYDSEALKLQSGNSSGVTILSASDISDSLTNMGTSFDHSAGKVLIAYSSGGNGFSNTGLVYNLVFSIVSQPDGGTCDISICKEAGQPINDAGLETNFEAVLISPTTIVLGEEDRIPPELSGVSTGPVIIGGDIYATSNEDGYIYLVPAETEAKVATVQAAGEGANGKKATAKSGTAVSISTSGLIPGNYKVYAIDAAGNLSAGSAGISIKEEKSSNADLATLTVNGSTVSEFSASTLNYYVILPSNTTEIPVVEASAADENVTVNITQASSLSGTAEARTATVTVTAEDKSQQIYTITFSVEQGATLYFDPPILPVAVGQTGVMSLKIRDVTDLYGADIQLTFNPSIVQVVYGGLTVSEAIAGQTVAKYTFFDNSTGLIRVVSSRQGDNNGFTGSGEMLRITFRGISSNSSDICFDNVELSDSTLKLIDCGKEPGTIKVTGQGTKVEGMISLQWVDCYAGGVQVKLVDRSNNEIASTTTDYSGYYVICKNKNGQPLQAGEYAVVAEKPVFLAGSSEYFTIMGGTCLVQEILLLTGDINCNNQVDVGDLIMLGNLYSKFFDCQDQENWYPSADLNRDNKVSLFDLVALAKNFDKEGYGGRK